MRTMRTCKMFAFGILSLAMGACSQSDSGDGNAGGTSGSGTSSGSVSSGGKSSGGASSSSSSSRSAGGSSAHSSSVAGSSSTGGNKSTGGATGGNKTGTTTSMGGAAGSSATKDTGMAGSTGSGGAGGTSAGGKTGSGGAGGGVGGAGGTGKTGGTSGAAGRTSTNSGACTKSKSANMSVSGSGTHKVVVETNSDSAMACGTIYRPEDLKSGEKYPIFAWGEGGCARDGKSNSAAMAEIASHGYFVIADGPLNGGNCGNIGMPNGYSELVNMGKPMLGYIGWAIDENDKPCSDYFDSLDTSKVAADGFSCGGLMAAGTSADPRMTTYGVTSSGLTTVYKEFFSKVHTPVKILEGGSGDVAYKNGQSDFEQLSTAGIPVVFFSKNGAGHGGTLTDPKGGEFTKVNLAWLNWQLKGDTGATGKGFLFGPDCPYCSNSGWEYKSKNIQ